jgi:hypothetical protein
MKRYFYLIIMIFCLGTVVAQSDRSNDERQKRWEEMKAKRAAFFTERIGFTEQEAQQFWPVYNKLQDEKGRLSKKLRDFHHNIKCNDKGEKIINYEEITDEMVNIKVQEANLDKVYHQKFKKILSPEKLFKYYQAERDWGGQLLKQIEKRGDQKK